MKKFYTLKGKTCSYLTLKRVFFFFVVEGRQFSQKLVFQRKDEALAFCDF